MVDIPEQALQAAIEAAGMEGWDHVEERMKAALTAAAPYMSGVKVKQLEWTGAPNDAGRKGLWFIAIDHIGRQYEILKMFNGQKGEGWDYRSSWYPSLEAAKAAAQADYEKRVLSALEPFQHSIGWLYDSDDAGTEFSENHPIESGECLDAKDIKPATAENLRSELLISWKAWAEDREELNKLRDAPSSAREQALEEAAQNAECHSDDRARRYSMDWNDGYIDGCKGAAAAIRALKSQPAAQTGGSDE